MTSVTSRWRPAVRMALRDVRRHRARSLLVVLLVGIPVMLSAMTASLIATQDESVAERLPVVLGRAQASVTAYDGLVSQNADAGTVLSDGSGERRSSERLGPELAELTRSSVLPVVRGDARAAVGGRGWDVEVLRTDLTSSLTKGMVVPEHGRLARSADEVVVTSALAARGARIGRTVVVGGQELTVVGIGTVGSVGDDPRLKAVAVPDSSVVPPSPADESSYLVDRREPVAWDEVRRLNRLGFAVISRAVVLDPPPSSEIDPAVQWADHADAQVAAIVVTALVIEVVLLAGPAFAVSARRQRRELATVASVGGSPGDLRRIVLAQALVLGVGACAAGVVLSVPATWLAARALAHVIDEGVGPFQVSWIAVGVAAALGVLASLVAAWVPARQAATADVVASLAGRAPAARPSAGWPVAGGLLMLIGLAGIVTQGSETGVAVLTILTVVGAVMLTPALIGLVARAADRLPLPLRLAVRDSDRQRARSTPAIAAIMASVSAVTALAIASSSDAAQENRSITYEAPLGSVTLEATTATMGAAVEAADAASGARFTPLPTIGTDDRSSYVSAMVPDPRYPGSSSGRPVAVADAKVLAGWGVAITPAQQAVLDGGRALVADASMVRRGQVSLTKTSENGAEESSIKLPAVAADLATGAVPQGPPPVVAGAVVSPATAQRLGLPVTVTTARADRLASAMDVAAVRHAVIEAAPTEGDVTVERVHGCSYAPIFAILAAMGALAIALGTFSATGLALSDARTDLATLVAVGASPRTRRLVAGGQALVLSVVGTVLGVLVGAVPGLAAARLLTDQFDQGYVIDVPWSLLALLVVGVPLVVSAVTALVGRGRPVAPRRVVA
jgi:putative ABC transport system permease protein